MIGGGVMVLSNATKKRRQRRAEAKAALIKPKPIPK